MKLERAMANAATAGSWRLIRKLGAGGMGIVYAAQDDRGNTAAVKLLLPGLAVDPAFRQRFAREVEIAKRVKGPRVARIIEYDLDADQPWMASELLEGPTLSQKVAKSGPLIGDELVGFAHNVAEGLQQLHIVGVIHRDLKPSNVVLTPDGPVIIDLGVAAAAELTAITATGIRFGSGGWMAPEQVAGEAISRQVDTFAYGLVVAFAATGHNPYGTGSAEALAHRVIAGSPDISAIPSDVRALVSRCLAHSPEARPSDADLVTWTQSPELLGLSVPTEAMMPASTAMAELAVPTGVNPPPEPVRVASSLPLIRLVLAVGLVLIIATVAIFSVAWVRSRSDGQVAANNLPDSPDGSPTADFSTTTVASPPSSAPPENSIPLLTASLDPGALSDDNQFARFVRAHLQERVRINVTWTPTSRSTFPIAAGDAAATANGFSAIPRCFNRPPYCFGGLEVGIDGLKLVPDATFSGVGQQWSLVGTFVVQFVQTQTGGAVEVHLRAVPADGHAAAATPTAKDASHTNFVIRFDNLRDGTLQYSRALTGSYKPYLYPGVIPISNGQARFTVPADEVDGSTLALHNPADHGVGTGYLTLIAMSYADGSPGEPVTRQWATDPHFSASPCISVPQSVATINLVVHVILRPIPGHGVQSMAYSTTEQDSGGPASKTVHGVLSSPPLYGCNRSS